MPPELQPWAESVSLWQALGWTAGFGAFLAAARLFVRKGWPALKRFAHAVLTFARVVDAVQGLPEFIVRTDAVLQAQNTTLGEQSEQIADIHHEVHFNNGSSVKDAVTRVEQDVKRVKRLLGEEETYENRENES